MQPPCSFLHISNIISCYDRCLMYNIITFDQTPRAACDIELTSFIPVSDDHKKEDDNNHMKDYLEFSQTN